MKPVLVGIAPSREGAEGQPLTSLGGRSTGASLAEMAALSVTAYLQRFDRVNLCPTPRPSTILVSEGRPMAMMLAGSLLRGRRVVLLGSNVAECFGLAPGWEPLLWNNRALERRHGPPGVAGFVIGHALPFAWAILPHPSGRNRWYNDPGNKARASAFLQELAEGWEGAD